MSETMSTITVNVDVTNPGQFFACCGLLELADRLWPGAEGWFANSGSAFAIHAHQDHASLDQLIAQLKHSGLAGELTPSLDQERKALEAKRRDLKKLGKSLDGADEARRKELGTLLREGNIAIGGPFDLLLDWWQEDRDDLPKTWAGSQQVLRIAQAALAACGDAFGTSAPFTYCCVLRPATEDNDTPETTSNPRRRRRKKNAGEGKVEPFYFDAGHGASARAIDVGFMPDAVKMTTAAYPAVELFALVGLQRFRPAPTDAPRVFDYCTWSVPLPPVLAAAAVCGKLPGVGAVRYRFENAFRTDQRKHKGFMPATTIGEER